MSLPYIKEGEIETLIDQKTSAFVRQLDTSSDMGARTTGGRGLMAIQFFEKKRRKAWFTKAEEEVRLRFMFTKTRLTNLLAGLLGTMDHRCHSSYPSNRKW